MASQRQNIQTALVDSFDITRDIKNSEKIEKTKSILKKFSNQRLCKKFSKVKLSIHITFFLINIHYRIDHSFLKKKIGFFSSIF